MPSLRAAPSRIVGIPPDTEKNVLKGVSARLPIYADSTYFILFNRSLQGILESVQAYAIGCTVTAAARRKAPACRRPPRLRQPVDLVQVPLFNPTASYSELCRAGRLRADPASDAADGRRDAGRRRLRGRRPRRRAGRAPRPRRSSARGWRTGRSTCRRCCCTSWSCRACTASRRSAVSGQLAALSFPFILATSFLGQALGLVFRHRETAVLLVLASSLPQFFLVGVSWPAEAIPSFLRSARELLPSVQRDRRLRADQPDGRLAVRGPRSLGSLWALTLLYFLTAAALAYLRPLRSSASCAGRLGRSRCWRASWRWPRWGRGMRGPRRPPPPNPFRAWSGRRRSRSPRRSAATSRACWCHVGST